MKGAQKAKQAKQEADGAAGPESDGCLGEKHMFQTFNLQELGVPAQAWPCGPTKGKLGYTVNTSNGAVSQQKVGMSFFYLLGAGGFFLSASMHKCLCAQ